MSEIERLKNDVLILRNASCELNKRVERLEEMLLTGRPVIDLPGSDHHFMDTPPPYNYEQEGT